MAAFLDWSTHSAGPPMPCRLCGAPALMRDERGRPCHKTCAEALTDDEDQGDVLAVVIEMPIAPVIDLATRRRIA